MAANERWMTCIVFKVRTNCIIWIILCQHSSTEDGFVRVNTSNTTAASRWLAERDKKSKPSNLKKLMWLRHSAAAHSKTIYAINVTVGHQWNHWASEATAPKTTAKSETMDCQKLLPCYIDSDSAVYKLGLQSSDMDKYRRRYNGRIAVKETKRNYRKKVELQFQEGNNRSM